ncbi:hypothetical protein E2320_014432, partial [Naja naja]
IIIDFYLCSSFVSRITSCPELREAVTEYPKRMKDSFRSSQDLLFSENFQEDQSQNSTKVRKSSFCEKAVLGLLESPLCAGSEGLAEPLLQNCGEAVTEYPKRMKDSFRSSQDLLFSENFQEDQSQNSTQESRKLSLDFLESPLCAGTEGLAEPLLQVRRRNIGKDP